MSMTRQSPHIFSRSAAAPWKAEWPASLPIIASIARSVPNGLPQRTQRNGSTSCSTRGCLARLAAVGQPQARLERDRVLGAGGRAQAALHAVLLDEAQLRPLGVVGQRAFGAGADAAQAHRAVVGVDAQAAERRAGGRQRDRLGAPAAPAASRWSSARSSVARLSACALKRGGARHAAGRRGSRSAASSAGRSRASRASISRKCAPRIAQAGRASPAPRAICSASACAVLGRLLVGQQHPDLVGALRDAPPATGRCRRWRVCHTRHRQHARRHAVHAPCRCARRGPVRRCSRAPAPSLWISSAASRPPARCVGGQQRAQALALVGRAPGRRKLERAARAHGACRRRSPRTGAARRRCRRRLAARQALPGPRRGLPCVLPLSDASLRIARAEQTSMQARAADLLVAAVRAQLLLVVEELAASRTRPPRRAARARPRISAALVAPAWK